MFRNVRRNIQALLSRGDVVHLHGIWDPILYAGTRAAERRLARYVVAPHGMLDPWSLRQKRMKKHLALRLYLRRILSRALFLHMLNEDESMLARPLGITAPHEIIPNGVFVEEMGTGGGSGSFVKSYPALSGKPYILFLSRLHHKKGLDVLAEAFEYVACRHPEVQLVVAGPDGGALAQFEKDIGNRGIKDRVHLVGPLYGRDKAAAYEGAAVFCLPSRSEGFSMAVVEALGFGLPVVISYGCHFPEVEKEAAGRLIGLDPREVGASLLELVEAPDLARQFGDNARRLALSHYTWPVIAKRTLDAYDAHLAGETQRVTG